MKITKITHLGRAQTFSPEMASDQHNYITINSNAVHKNSHSVSYCLLTLRTLFLKAHFTPEYYCAMLNDCHPDKRVRYMDMARSEEWEPTEITKLGRQYNDSFKFGTININNLTQEFTVTGNTVNQGLLGIKGIGESIATNIVGQDNFTSIEQFIEKKGSSKVVLERFIKLGAFDHLPGHDNAKALLIWYQFHYQMKVADKNPIISELLKLQGWDEITIKNEIDRQIMAYKEAYPKRKKIPDSILNWKPKPDTSREQFNILYKNDRFTFAEKLMFQKEYIGYYIDSPLEQFITRPGRKISDAIDAALAGCDEPLIEVVIYNVAHAVTKNGNEYIKLTVHDGIKTIIVFIWHNQIRIQDPESLQIGAGVRMSVNYDNIRKTFSLAKNSVIVKLRMKEDAT